MYSIGCVAVRAAFCGITSYVLSKHENDLATVSENKAKAMASNMLIYGIAKIIFSSLPSGPLGLIVAAAVIFGSISLSTGHKDLNMKYSEYAGYIVISLMVSSIASTILFGI